MSLPDFSHQQYHHGFCLPCSFVSVGLLTVEMYMERTLPFHVELGAASSRNSTATRTDLSPWGPVQAMGFHCVKTWEKITEKIHLTLEFRFLCHTLDRFFVIQNSPETGPKLTSPRLVVSRWETLVAAKLRQELSGISQILREVHSLCPNSKPKLA